MKGRTAICTNPMVPFVSIDNDKIFCDTSGGYWLAPINPRLKKVGEISKFFKTWGSFGRCVNGTIHFKVTVPVWEYDSNDVY